MTGISYRLISFGSLLLVVLFGVVASIMFNQVGTRHEQENLLLISKIVAGSVDGDDVALLTGSEADLGTPYYERVRKALVSACESSDDIRFVYLMGLKDGAAVFLADAEPLDSEDYSPPGCVLEQSSEELRQALEIGNAFIEGPLSDEYGIWVSGFSPVVLGGENEAVVLLGVDISAEDWKNALRVYQALGGVLVVSLLLICILFLRYLAEMHRASERIRAENLRRLEAEEREAGLGKILDESLNEIFIFDLESLRFVRVNCGARQNLGYSIDEICKMTPLDIAPQFGPDSFAEILRPLCEGSTTLLGISTIHRRKDGSEYPVEANLQLATYGNREVCIVVSVDITEQKEAKEALLQSEEDLQSILSCLHAGIVIVDPEKCIITGANPAALAMLDDSEGMILGESCKKFFCYADSQSCLVSLCPIRDDKKSFDRGEYLLVTRGGKSIPILKTASSVYLNGRDQILESFIDISDRKKAEEILAERTRELEKANENLEKLSITDPLTGLYNRRRLMEQVASEMERCRRYGSSCAVAMLDLDHFKKVNDTFGHDVGDLVLKGVSDVIMQTVRGEDCASRYGGEEFCVLFVECSEAKALAAAERIRAAIEACQFTDANGIPVAVRCSVGFATWREGEKDVDSFLKRADDALYYAKDTGRNRICQG